MSEHDDGQIWGKEMAQDEHQKTYAAFLRYGAMSTIGLCGILLFLLIFVY